MRYIYLLTSILMITFYFIYTKDGYYQKPYHYLFLGIFTFLIFITYNKFVSENFSDTTRFFIKSGLLCCLLVVLSFLAATASMFFYSKKLPKEKHDAIIILGAGLVGENLSYTLRSRVDAAINYYNSNPECVILASGGQGEDEAVTEAYAIQKYMLEKNIPPEKILVEEKSTSTKENFLFSKKILDEYFESKEYSVLFVTSDFHLLRSSFFCKDAGIIGEGLSSLTHPSKINGYYVREFGALMYYIVFENISKLF